MSRQLITQKRLLTIFANKLDNVVSKIKEEKLELSSVENNTSTQELHEMKERLQEASRDTLSSAFDYVILLQARLRVVSSCTKTNAPTPVRSSPTDETSNQHQMLPIQPQLRALEYPPLPVPSFSGNIWEWDNFWELFNNNTHSHNIPELIKFNYLISALKGEARESIRKFQVTSDNYTKAVQFLCAKYSNKEILVNMLLEKLEACTLRSASIKGQRALLEQLQVIVTQLVEKGEQVDSLWIVKKTLSKFPESVRRKVISKKQSQQNASPLTMKCLPSFLEEILSTEEMISLFTTKNSRENELSRNSNREFKTTFRSNTTCMYCKGDHSSFSCNKYVSAQERSAYLREHQLCMICASTKHKTRDCKRRLCFNCNGAHHTSCCFKSKTDLKSRDSSIFKKPESSQLNSAKSTKPSVKTNKSKTPTTQSNLAINAIHGESADGKTIQRQQKFSHPLLPTGELSIVDKKTGRLRKIDVLLDTGAELSFIDESLANELQLPILEDVRINLHTFGAKEGEYKNCNKVKAEYVDEISPEDWKFINDLKLPNPALKGSKEIQPLILLGCDYLWPFISTEKPPITLPSGLHLIPTKLGYLVSGNTIPDAQVNQSYLDEMKKWDQYWSMNLSTYTIISSASPVTEEDQEQWDKYWTMDNAGIEEFGKSEKEEQEKEDQKVWDTFNKTIEHRADGYYVRLPWREQ
ncbi:Tas retrotransposon peptidase A16 [Oesophagostomum dentatum]|uniref:Tas retrotransposon peptidase A16 n=1 Tax=Oesophagostomum dentatum TaxID=61180 RepID=A0A0B1T8Z9_OESDE|nr:Tas retrotransposon peptidase A16 [Oesophagostomum dentatum]